MRQISKTAVIYENVLIEEDVIIHDFVVIYPNSVIKSSVEIFDHCVIGKVPKTSGSTSRKITDVVAPTIIGDNTVLSPGCIIYAGVKIGKNTLLGDYCSIREECEIGDFCIVGRNVSVNYNTRIGDRTKVMDNSHITGNAVIEDDVFISVLVATTNDNTMGREEYSDSHVRGPWIKKGTTIGASANVLPGVTIGKNCIIAASALVSKDIPDGKVVMGIPGRIIRDVTDN